MSLTCLYSDAVVGKGDSEEDADEFFLAPEDDEGAQLRLARIKAEAEQERRAARDRAVAAGP